MNEPTNSDICDSLTVLHLKVNTLIGDMKEIKPRVRILELSWARIGGLSAALSFIGPIVFKVVELVNNRG